jgi:hypothetical protein
MSATNVRTIAPANDQRAMNTALNDIRQQLFQAMGIVRMAAHTIEDPVYVKAPTDVWTALDGAYDLLCRVADRLQTSETVLLGEVPHGEY